MGAVMAEPSMETSAGPALLETEGASRFIHSGSGLGLEAGMPVSKKSGRTTFPAAAVASASFISLSMAFLAWSMASRNSDSLPASFIFFWATSSVYLFFRSSASWASLFFSGSEKRIFRPMTEGLAGSEESQTSMSAILERDQGQRPIFEMLSSLISITAISFLTGAAALRRARKS